MAKNKKKVESLQELLEELEKDKAALIKYDMGALSDEQVAQIKEATGFDLAEYHRTMDSYGINHVMDKHANEKTEKNRGQIAVQYTDFELISLVTANPDKIEYAGKNRHGGDLLRYTKKIDQTIYYVEEIRIGKKEVVLQTLYKRK